MVESILESTENFRDAGTFTAFDALLDGGEEPFEIEEALFALEQVAASGYVRIDGGQVHVNA